jgi:hypothetical protein
MNKGENIYKQKHLILENESKQINFLDQRFYSHKGEFYPSVTHVLSYFPKGKFFEDWLKDVGHNADFIAKKAAEEGTQVHTLAEKYLEGEELHWLDERGNAKYSLKVWQMFLKFVEFWETVKPKLIASEMHLFSETHKIAGTCDLVVEINNQKWLLDIKTSNSLHTSYDLQTSVYAKCYEERTGETIDRTGVIWLKSSKRGPDNSGKRIQGKGWELYESSRTIEENFKLFNCVYELFKLETPYDKPAYNFYPTVVKINS